MVRQGVSLNISLSNNLVLLGGHFTRLEPLEVVGLFGFRCYLRISLFFCHVLVLSGSFVLQDMF